MLPWVDTFTYHHVEYRAEIAPLAAKPIRVFRGKKLIAEGGHKGLNPWKIRVGDVDGDGMPELAVGIKKGTKYLPQPHRCLFVYCFDGKQITKKWLGSSMGRPLVDFCFRPAPPGVPQRLFTLQSTLENHVALNRYVWTGFGFRQETPDRVWPIATSLSYEKGKLTVWDSVRHPIAEISAP